MGETAQEVKRGQGLFSAEERQSIVRSFIEQYVGGKVDISSWHPGSNVIELATGKMMSGAEKAEAKKRFLKSLESVCNPDPSMDALTLQAKVDGIFDLLVTFRSGGFLQGEFPVTPIAESRVSALETRVSSIERLFEELINRLKIKDP